jgi:hypothetical protein
VTPTARHAIDREFAAEGAEGEADLLANLLEVAQTKPHALDAVISSARAYAGYLSVASSEIDPLCGVLRCGAEAAGALFALATGSGLVEVDVNQRHVRLPSTGPTDATNPGTWRVGWWMAHVVRDQGVIGRLASTPVDVLRRSSTRGDECQYLYVEALQAVGARAPDWGDRLERALDSTDPERQSLTAEDFVLNIMVPEMEMLLNLGLGDAGALQEALGYALERHRKYWGGEDRVKDPDGFLALGPLAIASMAHDAGMAVEVESEYVPAALIQGACSPRAARGARG